MIRRFFVLAMCTGTIALPACNQGLVARPEGPVMAKANVRLETGNVLRVVDTSRDFARSSGLSIESTEGQFGFIVTMTKANLNIAIYNTVDRRVAFIRAWGTKGTLDAKEVRLAQAYIKRIEETLAGSHHPTTGHAS